MERGRLNDNKLACENPIAKLLKTNRCAAADMKTSKERINGTNTKHLQKQNHPATFRISPQKARMELNGKCSCGKLPLNLSRNEFTNLQNDRKRSNHREVAQYEQVASLSWKDINVLERYWGHVDR